MYPASVERRVCSVDSVQHSILFENDGVLDLWVDSAEDLGETDLQNQIEQALVDLPSWYKPKTIKQFPVPLSRQSALFNAKGVLKRAAAIELALSKQNEP